MMKVVNGEVAFVSAARTASATSAALAVPQASTAAVLMVHCTAASGTTPTLDVSLEESADTTTWTAVANSGITQLVAAGNRVSTAAITKAYVRVTCTIAGTTPSFTFSAAVLVFGAG